MCSDGVGESFSKEYDMQEYIKSITSVNPQEFAEQILAKALENNGGIATDDMTILIARIYNV